MAKIDKTIESIRNNPRDVHYRDLKKLLDYMGYEHHRTTGSHMRFKKKGFPPLSIVENNPVERYQVVEVLKVLDMMEFESQE